MLRSRLGARPLLLLCLVLCWAGSASALSFTMDDVNFTVGTASGTIQLVGGSEGAGPTGDTLSGTPGVSDDILIFRVVMTSGSIVEIGVGILQNNSSGSGTIAGGDVDVLNGFSATGPSLRTFSFDSDGDTTLDSLSDPSSSDQFWVTWASVADEATVIFMIDDGSTLGTVTGTINLPEPSGLALLGLAVAGLAGRRFLRG